MITRNSIGLSIVFLITYAAAGRLKLCSAQHLEGITCTLVSTGTWYSLVVSTGLYYNLIIILLIRKTGLTSIIFCSQFQRKKGNVEREGEGGKKREREGGREREKD